MAILVSPRPSTRPLEFYVRKVRAVPARPVLVTASIEADDYSAWWDLTVVFEQPDESLGWGPYWVNHEDPLNGEAVLRGHEVLGRRYYALMIASPPYDVIFGNNRYDDLLSGEPAEQGALEPREPDLDGADRADADRLARALAGALEVPVWVVPEKGPHWAWWDFLEQRAAEAGDVRAQLNIATAYLDNRHFGTPVEAAIWFRRAAEQGSAEAALQLGDMYATGRGVDEDATAAFGWFLRAAEAGSARAQFAAASAYERGDGVEADDVEAARWYARAAEQGEIAAQYNLALHYEYGRGVAKDLAAAARWLQSAAEGGSSWAQFRLAIAWEKGRGVPVDVAQALRWYRMAAAAGHERARERLKQLTR